MDEITKTLSQALDERRKKQGLSYERWGESTGIVYTSLYRFVKGELPLSSTSVRIFASEAATNGDLELLSLLAKYALGIETIDIVLN